MEKAVAQLSITTVSWRSAARMPPGGMDGQSGRNLVEEDKYAIKTVDGTLIINNGQQSGRSAMKKEVAMCHCCRSRPEF